MITLDILRDNREQKGWEFENFYADVHNETITTGDYTLAEFCDHDTKNDTYIPNFAIERKAGEDFVQSITHSRSRFLREIKRTNDWDSKLRVLIEEPKTLFKRNRGFMQYRDVTPSQIFGTVDSWEKYHNVSFEFAGTRANAQQIAYNALFERLQKVLTSED